MRDSFLNSDDRPGKARLDGPLGPADLKTTAVKVAELRKGDGGVLIPPSDPRLATWRMRAGVQPVPGHYAGI
jgi:hypothetical protein